MCSPTSSVAALCYGTHLGSYFVACLRCQIKIMGHTSHLKTYCAVLTSCPRCVCNRHWTGDLVVWRSVSNKSRYNLSFVLNRFKDAAAEGAPSLTGVVTVSRGAVEACQTLSHQKLYPFLLLVSRPFFLLSSILSSLLTYLPSSCPLLSFWSPLYFTSSYLTCECRVSGT